MGMEELSDNLALPVRERVLELLETPYAGSKAYMRNHQDAKYISNCHGTMNYVLNLDDLVVTERGFPDEIPGHEMQKRIDKYCLPTKIIEVGDLIGFYEITKYNFDYILHSALVIGSNNQIFQQSGPGGIFELSTIDEKLRSFAHIESLKVRVKSYGLKGNI